MNNKHLMCEILPFAKQLTDKLLQLNWHFLHSYSFSGTALLQI